MAALMGIVAMEWGLGRSARTPRTSGSKLGRSSGERNSSRPARMRINQNHQIIGEPD
jgi:hypothetical protein